METLTQNYHSTAVTSKWSSLSLKSQHLELLPAAISSSLQVIIFQKSYLNYGKLADGIFDKLSSKECVQTVWKGVLSQNKHRNAREKCAVAIEGLLKEAMMRKSLDNVTAVMISFTDFKDINQENAVIEVPRDSFFGQSPTSNVPNVLKRGTSRSNPQLFNDLTSEKSSQQTFQELEAEYKKKKNSL